MKILAFTDMHGMHGYAKVLLLKAADADLLVCAGDISDWGQDVEKQIRLFEKLGKPFLIIPGNHEDEDILRKICQKISFCCYLHKGSYELGNYIFFGYGGGGFSERDKEFERIAGKFKAALPPGKKVIVVTHGPPYGTKLDLLQGAGHRGCKSLRDFLLDVRPMLHICGHLHENAGNIDKVGVTTVINPGPEGRIIEI